MLCSFDSIPFFDVQVPLEQDETEILQASPVRKVLGQIRPEWHLDNCRIEVCKTRKPKWIDAIS